MTPIPSVAVIITAKDAAQTCALAVRSALAQRPVTEVIFVDDGSRDGTLEVARSADDGSGRLKPIRLDKNQGPARGRNLAIEAASADYLCILDADDFLGERRIEQMFALGGQGWDLLADELIFASGPDPSTAFERQFDGNYVLPHDLTLSQFAIGNLPRKDRYRRELGFLKPVIRRAFVAQHGIRYDERLRLGEDLLYYAECLLHGAVFRMVETCGYYAVQSPHSLSAQHRAGDIAALLTALEEFEARGARDGLDIGLTPRYTENVRRNLALRCALDRKREGGWRGFATALREHPASARFVVRHLVWAKLQTALGR